MEIIGILLTIVIFASLIVYIQMQNEKEKKMIIRELTTSLKSKDIGEYKDNTPEYKSTEVEEEQKDELIPLEELPPDKLLKAISDE